MKIVILTGAGISAESGLATFRDSGGLWEGHDIVDVATPEAFERNPDLVHQFYDLRRSELAHVHPNAAHTALAELEEAMGDHLTVVTQNVDDLHERAGSTRVVHMHGELRSAWCRACDHRTQWDGELGHRPPCPACGIADLRPDIVWFGEIPYFMDEIEVLLKEADLFAAIGTSGEVYPAAGFAAFANSIGATTLEFNLRPTVGFDRVHRGPATETVPAWVNELLG